MELADFLRSLIRSVLDGLRRNKLPACLSLVALVLTTALAFTSEFDERPRYRQLILPHIAKAEQQFFTMMEEAERQQDGLVRLQYFLEAHRRAKSALSKTRFRPARAQIPLCFSLAARHRGYEPSAVQHTFTSLAGFRDTVAATMSGRP